MIGDQYDKCTLSWHLEAFMVEQIWVASDLGDTEEIVVSNGEANVFMIGGRQHIYSDVFKLSKRYDVELKVGSADVFGVRWWLSPLTSPL